jgi:CheY-like chemotaxis protein/signal transduction histidine kinase
MALDIGGPNPLARLLAGIADAAVVVDEAGLVTGWNDAARDRFALQAEAARGRPLAEVVGSGPPAVRLSLGPDAGGGELLAWRAGRVGSAPTADDIELQKADALGRLAGGISHDLANRLGGSQGLLSLLATDARLPYDARKDANDLARELERGLLITRGLLAVARHRPPPAASVLVGPLVRETLELTANAMLNVDDQVAVLDELPAVDVDETRFRQALLAVTLNAIEAMGGEWTRGGAEARGQLRVSGGVVGEGDAGRVRLTFEDDGAAVPEAERDALFGGGGGRATRDLAVAHALIAACGGRLAYEPLPDGNRLVVELPLASADPPTVLLCDDEDLIRGLLVRVLQAAGYRTVEASGGPEALERLETDAIDLVIADHGMPGMTGVELYRRAVERRPLLRTRFIITSGDPGTADLVALTDRDGVPIIEKPFLPASKVTDAVRRLLGR